MINTHTCRHHLIHTQIHNIQCRPHTVSNSALIFLRRHYQIDVFTTTSNQLKITIPKSKTIPLFSGDSTKIKMKRQKSIWSISTFLWYVVQEQCSHTVREWERQARRGRKREGENVIGEHPSIEYHHDHWLLFQARTAPYQLSDHWNDEHPFNIPNT